MVGEGMQVWDVWGGGGTGPKSLQPEFLTLQIGMYTIVNNIIG